MTDVRGTVATLALHDVIEVEDTAALRMQHRPADNPVGSVFYATNGHVENTPPTIEIITEHARLRLDTDLTVAHDDGRVETFRPATVASGERLLLGRLPRPADRRLLPARPRGQALLDRRTRRPGELAGDPGRVRPTPADVHFDGEEMITPGRARRELGRVEQAQQR